MPRANDHAELCWGSCTPAGWHTARMTSHQLLSHKRGFSIEETKTKDTYIYHKRSKSWVYKFNISNIKYFYLWQKSCQDEKEDDEWGDHARAHTSRVEENLTPSHGGKNYRQHIYIHYNHVKVTKELQFQKNTCSVSPQKQTTELQRGRPETKRYQTLQEPKTQICIYCQ